MTTTVIIPIYNLDDSRKRNFDFVLQRCLESKADEVIVVQQINENDPINIEPHPKLKNIIVETDTEEIQKCMLCNVAARKSSSDYLIFNDADIYVKLDSVIDSISKTDIVVKPFKYFVKLTEQMTDEFIVDGHTEVVGVSSIYDLGAGAIVVKRDAFMSIRGYDERYSGWGFEDQEFARRLKMLYPINVLDLKGVHLYHSVQSNFEVLNRNSMIYRACKVDMQNLEDYIKTKVRSKIIYNGIHANKYIDNQKFKFIEKLAKNSKKNVETGDFFYTPKEVKEVKSICHIVAPALVETNEDLYRRELLAINSIIDAKKDLDCVTNIMYSINEIENEHFLFKQPKRTALDIGCKKSFVILKDTLDEASSHKCDVIVYTNSDCCISKDFYLNILNMKNNVIEYHRRDVKNNPTTLTEVFTNPAKIRKTGVDGLVLKTDFYEANKNKINFNFYLGCPHWDTTICGTFRKLGISNINHTDLYHPIHEQAWCTKNLDAAGQHNTQIYRDYLKNGALESRVLDLPTIDLSIVIVHYGKEEQRLEAIRNNFIELKKQDIDCEYVFVELISDVTSFPELKNDKNFKHIQIEGNDNTEGIWQKEALMNIGVKNAIGKYIIFLDSDVHSTRPDWFRRIRNKIKDDPRKMVQGFKTCRDSKYPKEHSFISVAAQHIMKLQTDLMHNPGMVWGISKSVLIENDYINPYMIYGGGDSLFMYEYLGDNKDNELDICWIATFDKISNIKRKLEYQGVMDCVDDDIIHINHGKVGKRNYKTRHYMTGYFTKDITELVTLNENGLLEWINPNCPERQMCLKRYEMDSIHEVRDICEEILKACNEK